MGYVPGKFQAVYKKEENRMVLLANDDLPMGTLLADSPISELLIASGNINGELFASDSDI